MATAKDKREAAEARLFNTTRKRTVYSSEERTGVLNLRVEPSLLTAIAGFANVNHISKSDAGRMLLWRGLEASKDE